MAKRFLVRGTNNKWDEVTQYVWNNRKFVVDPNDESKPKYSETAILVEDGEFKFFGPIQGDELGKLARYLQVTIPVGVFTSLVDEPETVQIVKGNSCKLHIVKTGVNWTKQVKKAA